MKNCLGRDCPYCNEKSCRICQPTDHLYGRFNGLLFSCHHSIHGRHDDIDAAPHAPVLKYRCYWCALCGKWHMVLQAQRHEHAEAWKSFKRDFDMRQTSIVLGELPRSDWRLSRETVAMLPPDSLCPQNGLRLEFDMTVSDADDGYVIEFT